MKAFQITELLHPSKIAVSSNVPDPVPSGDHVLVDVYSSGLNFFDILQAQGKHQSKPPLPFILGSEFAGRIAPNSPIPAGCPFKAGDRVFGATQGTFAERVSLSWKGMLPLPDALTFDQGAGLFVTWPTSYEGLVGRAELKAGEWVLITAAAGGVGIAAVQLAKALGANVIAACGSQEKLDVAKRYGGADYLVNYSQPGWQKEVLKITKNKGVDVIYDPVGLIKDSLKCIAWKGRAVVVGFAGGNIEQIPSNLILLKNIAVTGVHWGAYARNEPKRSEAVWKAVLEILSKGRTVPVVYPEVFAFDKITDGLAALEGRKTWGKVIVKIREEKATAKL